MSQPAGSAMRGAALIVVAVVVGFLLIQDDEGLRTDLAVGDDSDALTVATEPPESSTTDTTEPPASRPPSEVKVIVANAARVPGAAGRATEQIEELGYSTGVPTDAPEQVQTTQVLHQPGFEQEAAALAESLGAPADGVSPLPSEPPIENLEGSQILVLLAPDVATPAG